MTKPADNAGSSESAETALWNRLRRVRDETQRRLPSWVLGPIGLLALIVAVGVLWRTYRITAPILDQHLFRQTQTASTVWLFDRFGYDPLNYRVPMFGAGNWVLEFPTYQSVVYGVTLVTGFDEWVGRAVSILSFVAAAWLLFLLVRRWTGSQRVGIFAVFFFAFLPISVFYFRAYMIDPLVIALTLAALLAATHLLERWTWTAFSAYGITLLLAALSKPTIVAALGIPLATLAVRTLLSSATPLWGRLSLIGTWVTTAIALLLWIDHSDTVNIRSNGMSFDEMRDWYFGSTFTDATLWSTVGGRISENLSILGVALVALGIAALPSVRTRYRWELGALLVSAVLTVGIFANLNEIHDYYQLPYYVTLSIFGGLGLGLVYSWVSQAVSVSAARQLTAGAGLVLLFLWSVSLWSGYFGPEAVQLVYQDQGRELAANTPDERLIVMADGADANEPMLFYEARRTGWRVPTADWLQAQRLVDENDDVGAVAVQGGPTAVTPEVQGIVDGAGYARTYESPSLVVFTAPGDVDGTAQASS